MATLSDLVKDISQGTYFTSLMAKHKANGVPTASWLSIVNVGLSLTQLVAELLAELRGTVRQLAAAAFLEYASGVGLTLLAKSAYQLDRQPATFTIGDMVLASVPGAPSYTFAAGDIIVGTPGPSTAATRLFVNKTGGTLNPGGTLTLSFIATEPGPLHNIPPGSPLDLKTSFAGASVTNPAGVSGTWITNQGAPEETDDRLKLRCAARWGTLGVGGNEDAFLFWCLAIPNGYTSSPVSRAKIFSNYLDGTFAPGAATVCAIGPAGALPGPDVAAIQQNFEAPITSLASSNVPGLDTLGKKYPIACQVKVITATNKTIVLTGVVSIFRRSLASLADVQAAVTAELARYQSTLDIGQTIYPQRKVAGVIESAPPFSTAIRDVDLSGMAATILQGRTEYPVLDASGLTYQMVDG